MWRLGERVVVSGVTTSRQAQWRLAERKQRGSSGDWQREVGAGPGRRLGTRGEAATSRAESGRGRRSRQRMSGSCGGDASVAKRDREPVKELRRRREPDKESRRPSGRNHGRGFRRGEIATGGSGKTRVRAERKIGRGGEEDRGGITTGGRPRLGMSEADGEIWRLHRGKARGEFLMAGEEEMPKEKLTGCRTR